MNRSNKTSLNSSVENLRRNELLDPNPLAPKKLHGNVTLEMIDEFFNPLSRKKDPSKLSLFKSSIPGPVTNGLGIIKETTDESHSDQFFYDREQDNNNTNYAEKIKEQFERELIESSALITDLNLSMYKIKDENSIIGSGMSQIESVSSMNMSLTSRLRAMNQARNLTRIVDDEESIDLNNNRLGNELREAAAVKDIDDDQRKQQDILELAKTYKKRKNEPNLSISARRDEIVQHVNSSQFCVIKGSTGCGKTTQVPQFILDDHVERKKHCNIIVTQPRRIAATSVARRVCSERSWDLGDLCGYQIGLDRQCNTERTRILYVTTGVLLQKLIGPQADENFDKYTHIIIDEVHERDLDTDFVLLVIKLKSYRNLSCKIVLMSATIETEKFSNYFIQESSQFLNGRRMKEQVPIFEINIEPYKVQEYYWEDLARPHSFLSYTIQKNYQNNIEKLKKENHYQKRHDDSLYQRNYKSYGYNKEETFSSIKQYRDHIQTLQFSFDNPEISNEALQMCLNLLHYFDDEDLKSFENQTKSVDDLSMTLSSLHTTDDVPLKNNRIIDGLPEIRGSVLIFVPGMHNIQQLNDLINKEFSPDYKIDVLPLHSEIPLQQQQRVFSKSKTCHRKVIISTSIAESSITVPDIKYVIDFCLTKELYCDPQTNYTHLRQEWASKSSLDQRRGRAGRVSEGICFRLITRDLFSQLDKYNKPSILREPLSHIVLNVKRLNLIGEPKKILSMAIEPPRLSDIQRTILVLKEVGALTLTMKNQNGQIETNPNDGDLTYAGKIMANLPIDERLSKLILLGHVFGKLKEAIIIAAGLSTKTIFTSYYKSYLESYKSKWMWAAGWMCDCLAILNAVNTFDAKQDYLLTHMDRIKWCKANNIEFDRLKEVIQLRLEIEQRLLGLDINQTNKRYQSNVSFKTYDLDDEDQLVNHYLIIKMMIAGAFYPNYLNSSQVDINEAYKLVGFHDIKTTVLVKNFPNNEGILYDEKLTDLFRPCSNAIQNHFEDTKAYVEFKDEYEGIKSNINFSVYLAVEMRLLRIPMTLRRYNSATSADRLKQIKQAKNSSILNISVDKNPLGIMKFEVGSILSLNKMNSTIDLNESISDAHTLVDEYSENSDTDSISEFVVSKPKTKDLDQSQFLSCASMITCMTDTMKMRNLETSSRISGSRVDKNSIMGSSSNVSSIKKPNQLISNRLTSTSNTDYTIVDHLRNPKFLLPEKVDHGELVDICVTEVIECGHFWVQISDDAHKSTLKSIFRILNRADSVLSLSTSVSSLNTTSSYHCKLLNQNKIVLNALCVTHFSEDKKLYRAQIININKTEQKATVLFIDFGNKEKKCFKELYEMSLELFEFPFQALECRLANIKMSILKNPNSIWTKSANDLFVKIIKKNHGFQMNSLKIKVIDLIDSVAMVRLVSQMTDSDIGEEIISAGYAERVDSLNSSIIKLTNTDHVLYVPGKQNDYTSKRPQIAGGILTQEIGHFNVKSKLNYLPINRSINESFNRFNDTDSFDDYDHDNLSTISDSTSMFAVDENNFAGVIDLNGPYSPLEVHYYALVNVGRSKKTRVSRGSINHVTLDDDPFNDTPRLMISTSIFLNSSADTIVMRHTTLMPKLRGLTTICCLLFSPVVEFRLDERKTSITGALCGLGADSNGSIYTDNDIEMTFDVLIDMNDVDLVNKVRLAINNIIGNETLAVQWTNDDTNLKNLQQRNCQMLLDVIQRPRKAVEPKYPLRPHKWNQINPSDLKEWNWRDVKKAKALPETTDEYYGYHSLVALNKS